MSLRFALSFLALVAAALVLSSCVGGRPSTVLYSPDGDVQLCRVAVMPFVNQSEDSRAALVTSRIFHNRLVNHSPFEIEPEGSVQQFLLRNRIMAEEFYDARGVVYGKLGEELHVDAIVRGKIFEFGEKDSGAEGVIPLLHMQIELVDAKTGALISSSTHQRQGSDYRKMMHFGIIHTRTGLLAQTVDEIVAKWKKEGIEGCR